MKYELKIEPKVVERLRLVLKGLAPATPENIKIRSGSGHRFSVDEERLPLDTLPYLVLMAIGCTNLGRAEKMAWAIPFVFDGVYCDLASEKSGLQLYLDKTLVPDEASGTKVAADIVTRLCKGQQLLENEVLRPLAMSELRSGRVAIRNQYYGLRETYEYFRDGAVLAYDGKGRAKLANRIFAEAAEGFHNTIAMVGAYFSLLEHILVLVSPFVNHGQLGQELLRFIGDKWSSKFKSTFDIGKDREAKRFYDELGHISEEYRNTFAHGGFDKSRATIGFHVPGAGWLPAVLSDVRDRPHFNLVPANHTDFAAICKLFDDLEAWMEVGPAEYGITWAKSGLDVRFDAEFQAELEEALEGGQFMELVDRTAYYATQHANMDY